MTFIIGLTDVAGYERKSVSKSLSILRIKESHLSKPAILELAKDKYSRNQSTILRTCQNINLDKIG